MTNSSTVRIYLREIAAYPLLTADDEIALAQRIEAGCEEARTLLIKSNLRLVVHIAHGFHIPTMDMMDLVSEGNIGLMKAVERYDWRRGCRFIGAARIWIEESIKRAITDKSRLIRLPQTAVAGLRRRAANDEPEENGVMIQPASLDELSLVHDSDMAGAVHDLREIQGLKTALSRAMNVLTAREQEVLHLRFAISGGDEDSLRAVGRKLGLSYERVRQIQVEAMEKLKSAADKLGMREYL